MKISYCSLGFQRNKRGPVEVPLREVIAQLAEAGYDGIEIWERHQHDLSDAELDDVRRQLNNAGMRAAMLSPYFDFTTSEESAAASVREGRWLVERAQRLGAPGIRVFAGRCGSAVATSEQWQRAVRSLQTLAEQSTVFWAVEPHDGTLADSAEKLLQYVREVNRPNVKVIYQATNLLPDYLGALGMVTPYIAHVHANTVQGDLPYPPLEAGELDYGKIVTGLRAAGFAGYISVENLGPASLEAMWREVKFLRQLAAK